MHKNICIVKLPGKRNYALISPGRIAYGLNASEPELQGLVAEEETFLLEQKAPIDIQDPLASVSIGLIPTFDCNLGCIYCYARGGETKEIMPLEIGMAAIKDATRSENRELLRIYLVGGGEPLLYFDLVKQLIDYARATYQNVEVNVVTNGTFDNNVLKWLLKYGVNVRVSYDGAMHDVQRPYANGKPSSFTVENNIRRLILGGAFVIVQSIVTRDSLGTMQQTIDRVVPMGVNAIKFEPAIATGVSRASSITEPDPKQYAEALWEAIRYVAEQGYDLTVDTGFFGEPSTDYYCGMPVNNRIVTPLGKVTSCVEVARPGDPYANTVMVGNISGGRMVLDKTRKEALRILHYANQLEGCSSCNLRMICHGGCPMANIWRNGLPIRKSMFTCTVEHTLLPKLLLAIAEDPRIAKIVMEGSEIDRF